MKSERIFPEIMIKYIPHLEYGEEYDEKLFQIKNKTTGERVLLFATLFMMDIYKRVTFINIIFQEINITLMNVKY